ncbi:MAG TPA: bifunctional phosphoribosylaminoimidazolecarboxamide formyltransferase/IMP cyclohydrolase [Dehalococcoidia bacterium]|nr:bifunctional phosphoribosylaminoimidazolecarboxamide formyltransferase/IMP cyclohydrolase [Dehalococcoidia bacterium]
MSPVAILAPYDKTGLKGFALQLAELGYDIYSTGGTHKHLLEAGLAAQPVSSLTGFPEVLDGRVKTLHPAIHGGILARRDVPDHMKQLAEHKITPIDLVCVNLYPFRETISRPDVTLQDALENIDIGGPTMIRAAAKNFPHVLVLVDPDDYDEALDHLAMEQVPEDYRQRLAAKAFQHVAAYDTMIARYLRGQDTGDKRQEFPAELTLGLVKVADTRYGENPHQRGAVYRDPTPGAAPGVVGAEQLHGMEMSYLNYFDADAAWRGAIDFDEPTVVIVKHGTPCGVASHEDVAVAYERAYESDTISPFGGIIALNREVTWDMTEAMRGKRYDIIVAPGYEERALERLKKRDVLRILQMPSAERTYPAVEYREILGGMLAHEPDRLRGEDLEFSVVTKRAPTAGEADDLRFAWTCVKHVKSNSVVIAKERATVGIGGGQPNRLWPTRQAIERAGERIQGAVIASDAFFPFAKGDAVEDACKAGIAAIIQPGGGNRDEEAVEVCNEYGVAMVFTGTRGFRH